MNESRLGYILQGGYILGGVDPYSLLVIGDGYNMLICPMIMLCTHVLWHAISLINCQSYAQFMRCLISIMQLGHSQLFDPNQFHEISNISSKNWTQAPMSSCRQNSQV